MKAISKRQYQAMITALQQLEEQELLKLLADNWPTDGFSISIEKLGNRYQHYKDLLSKLADCMPQTSTFNFLPEVIYFWNDHFLCQKIKRKAKQVIPPIATHSSGFVRTE